MEEIKKSKLILVGAGPGDPDLITVKGLKAIQTAKVLLYDALVAEELIALAPENCIKVYVGKRAGQNSVPQEKINQLILSYSVVYGEVVRLKGGDPFVFGRGFEELEYANMFGIETQVIPGLSSATSLPALQNIPLTHRGSNESFWVVTASKMNDAFGKDLKLAAQSSATVVVLMGLRKLAGIVTEFKKHHSDDYPIAVIQSGSTPQENKVIGGLSTIEKLCVENKIGAPAIIIVGQNVALPTSLQLAPSKKKFPVLVNVN